MKNIKLILEYDGTGFKGFQVQPSERTVQGEIEKALLKLTGEDIRISVAGRTDTGVHAKGQVVGFSTRSLLPITVIKNALNALLPRDIRILSIESIRQAFNARKNAKFRTYRYVLAKRQTAIGRQYCWYTNRKLDLSRMREAAEYFIGEHDFTAFCKTDDDLQNHNSRIINIDWIENDDQIQFEITGERFFHHMVRIIIGTLIEVGAGKRNPVDILTIISKKDRRLAGATAPPNGLHLIYVSY